ncbi:MAG: peptidyl-prolyl cis-trans isomerase [Flavobacteriaceae bacterium]
MLDSLRRSAGSWVAKVFIGILVLSFAVWGIADIFRGYGGSAVVRVGGTEIDAETFRREFQLEIQRRSRELGQQISFAMARSIGLDRLVLGKLTAQAALDETASQKNLRVTDEAVARNIRQDPSFRNASGQFDREYFEAALRQLGYNEAGFIAERRALMGRQALANGVAGEMTVPEPLRQAVGNYRFEKRQFRYLIVGQEQAGTADAPAEEALRTYFEENKSDFRAPEYRALQAIKVEPADLTSAVDVSEQDIREAYEREKERFTTPERRRVRQMVFADKSEAEAVAGRIDAGARFEDVAFERGLKPDDIDLGMVARSEIADPAVADAAFSLATGETSAPIDGRFGTVIVNVGEIEPGGTKPLEEVTDEIRADIAGRRAEQDVLDMHDRIEDERAAGATLEEIARKENLELIRVEAVDSTGLDPQEKPVELPAQKDLLSAAFNSDVGIENDPVQFGKSGLVWFDVTAITPARERTFEEAEAKVRQAWQKEADAEKLNSFTESLATRIRDGANMDDLAKEIGVAVTRSRPLTRSDQDADLPAAALDTGFATPEGAVATARAGADRRVVMRVEAVTPPEEHEVAFAGDLAANIAAGYADDLLTQYVQAIEKQFEVTYNQQMLNQALGISSQEN